MSSEFLIREKYLNFIPKLKYFLIHQPSVIFTFGRFLFFLELL